MYRNNKIKYTTTTPHKVESQEKVSTCKMQCKTKYLQSGSRTRDVSPH